MVKKLIVRILLFLSPYLLYFSIPAFVLWRSGELENVEHIVQRQTAANEPHLLGLAYTNPDIYYKYAATVGTDPEVLILGSSRVMQFRKEMFEGVKFYNAGGAISSAKDLMLFMRMIENRSGNLKYIVMNLDPWWFIPTGVRPVSLAGVKPPAAPPVKYDLILTMHSTIYESIFDGKISLSRLWQGNEKFYPVGITANMNGQGFRNDGSYYYGKAVKDSLSRLRDKYSVTASLTMMNAGIGKFKYADSLNTYAIQQVAEFLTYCKSRNIKVIGFIPPFVQPLIEKYEELKDKYKYVFQMYPVLREVFEENGYHLGNYHDMQLLGATDGEFIDSFHGSERTYVRILLDLARSDANLGRIVNVSRLQTAMRTSTEPKIIFSDIYEYKAENEILQVSR